LVHFYKRFAVAQERMKWFSILLVFLIQQLANTNATVNSCISCTSDDGRNPGCEGGDVTNQPTVACSLEFGNEGCFVLWTKNKMPGLEVTETWNRGCCTPKEGSMTCPTNGDTHENNDAFERYRSYCTTDNCNTDNPKTNNGGGGNWEGGLVVPGRSLATLQEATVVLPLTLLLSIYPYL